MEGVSMPNADEQDDDSSVTFAAPQNGPDGDRSAQYQIYKLVLTGGPCGGKTTGQDRLATFFEGFGWKVFTVPEIATILLNGRIRFVELSPEQSYRFQKDLLLTLIQVEKVFFNQAELVTDRNVLIICDRGAMDSSAYMEKADWERMLQELQLDTFELRDNRYNQVVHMVSAADGAKEYYSCRNNTARYEKNMEHALEQDLRTRESWLGHPCLSIVDNSDCRNFDQKLQKLIGMVCKRMGISFENLTNNSKKRKWLVIGMDEGAFGKNRYEEFDVIHTYLRTTRTVQVRLRKRWQKSHAIYTLTTRRYEAPDGTKLPEPVETRKQLRNKREYNDHMTLRDTSRLSVHKKRRCFVYGNVYFSLDIFVDPLPPACVIDGRPLMILESYTNQPAGHSEPKLPPFLTVQREVTGELAFSMYILASSIAPSSS